MNGAAGFPAASPLIVLMLIYFREEFLKKKDSFRKNMKCFKSKNAVRLQICCRTAFLLAFLPALPARAMNA